jgi:hypothetical protein
MTLSFRAGFTAINVSSNTSPSYPSSFASAPQSLAEGIKAMLANPDMKRWVRANHETFVDHGNWKEECQGITYDGKRFICSSNGSEDWVINQKSPKALYRFRESQYSFKDEDIEEIWEIPKSGADPNVINYHLGDIDFYNGIIYCAVETRKWSNVQLKYSTPKVIKVDARGKLKFLEEVVIHGTEDSGQGGGFPWCAINPWNGLLYSSFAGDEAPFVTKIYAYDPNTGDWVPDQTIDLQPSAARRVQGGCFSPNGHLYLACDNIREIPIANFPGIMYPGGTTITYTEGGEVIDPATPEPYGSYPGLRNTHIRAFSAFNGAFLGETPVTTLESKQELQGLCYAPYIVVDQEVQIHVILLENEVLEGKDDVYIKPYIAPYPDRV